MIKLETDLRSIQITSKAGEKASYAYGCYSHVCPIPRWAPPHPHGLMPYSLTLHTFITDVIIKRLEPGVFYRLPDVACQALGSDESLGLIPLYVEIEHTPYIDLIEDEHGRAYVPNLAVAVDRETIHTSRLCYGSWTVCGLLRAEQAREWAGLDDALWQTHSLFNKVTSGRDPSWLPLRDRGSVAMSFNVPLLYRPVEAYRETV